MEIIVLIGIIALGVYLAPIVGPFICWALVILIVIGLIIELREALLILLMGAVCYAIPIWVIWGAYHYAN